MSETNEIEVNGKKEMEPRKMSREEKVREAKIEDQVRKILFLEAKEKNDNQKLSFMHEKKNSFQITKGVAAISTAEDKIQFLTRKLVESEKTNKKISVTSVATKKEKDYLQQEYNKAILTKTKLESLCRELQKQNKLIKDESLSKIRAEEEARKETQVKFQKSLNEIQALMNDNNEKNMKLKQDNQEMTDKFKYILEQYELREQQMEKINKQLELVQQLSDAKVAKVQIEMQAEREQFITYVHYF